ncbi:MAG: isochorismatase family protein [Nitrososphaerales archaeon]
MVTKVDRSCALLIIDMQNDFMPNGSLPVPGSDKIIPVLNSYMDIFTSNKLPIFATRDWHPPNHISFKQRGGMWPMHCVKDTIGAEFPSELKIRRSTTVISAGYEYDKLGYSGFEGTELARKLEQRQIKRLLVGGVATDYCVKSTVLDALSLGFDIVVLQDAVKAIKNGDAAMKEMQKNGAKKATIDGILA